MGSEFIGYREKNLTRHPSHHGDLCAPVNMTGGVRNSLLCALREHRRPISLHPGMVTSKLGRIESRTRTELADQLTRKDRNRIYLFIPLYGYLATVIARWRRR